MVALQAYSAASQRRDFVIMPVIAMSLVQASHAKMVFQWINIPGRRVRKDGILYFRRLSLCWFSRPLSRLPIKVRRFCIFGITALYLLKITYPKVTTFIMKKQWVSWVSISMLVLLLVSWQGQPKTGNYDNLWKRVRQYSQKDLPKSALKTVELIYTKANAEGNESQVLKTLIYRIGLQSTFQEDFRLKSIREFEKEVKTATQVEKPLLYSLLGQLYQGYFDSHFNKILNRKTSAFSGDTSLETLNARQWNRKISHAYLASVSPARVLSRVRLSGFSAILQNDSSALALWPTLYDLLANRAIDYFSSGDAQRWLPKSTITLDTGFLAPAANFIKLDFPGDSTSVTGNVLVLFQHLLRLHKAQNHPAAFVDADLKRLAFVNSQLPDNYANGLAYSHTLEKLLQQFQNKEASVRIADRLAHIYRALSSHNKSPVNYLLKAEETCKRVLKAFPTAPFANNCKNTITQINKRAFRMKMQQALLPDKPFLSLITYKNSAKLYFRVVKISPDVENPSAGENLSHQMKESLQKPAFKKWEQSFPFADDHRMHTAEIAMPGLPLGTYVIFVSDNPRFSKESTVLYQQIQVTRMALLSQKNNSAQALDIYLLDRAGGTPVSGATIKVFGRSYDYRAREQQITPLGNYSSDADGFLQIPLKNDREFNGFILKAYKGADTTFVNTFARFYGSLYVEKPVLHTYLFTDRAIYRPGQAVYFKGVVVESKGNDARVKAGVKQDVQLLNAQYKKLDELHLVTDASGSVSGSFILPDVALNGRFTIKTATGMVSIRMEDYKRPAFYVVFDTLKKAYTLNDEITLTGKVAYYFGGIPDNIPVKYTIKRESYFPVSYYGGWYPVSPGNTEIAGGTVRTDSTGRFQITFRTLADKNIPRDAYPVYRFVLHAEATDASGETHVATQDIRLSRLALLLKLRVPQNVIREQSHGIEIVARNLSGAEVPASVQVKLYKLTTPGRYLLKRLWPKPDTVLVTKDYFTKNFPHLAYRNEDDKNHWKQTLTTSEEMRVNGNTQVFTKKLERLKPGEYLIVVTAKGQPEVSVRKFFSLTSERSSKLPVKDIFWHNLSADRAEPGNVLQLRVGSASGNMRMLYEVLNGREVVQRQWITAGKKLLKQQIPVEEAFRGNFVVRLLAVHSNRFFSWLQTVKVPFTNKKLSVSLQTNRNFLKPGEKEQWTIQIKSASGKVQSAFLLAGMYDASLDVYAANRWNMFPYHSKTTGPFWRSYLFNTGYNRTLYRVQTKTLSKTILHHPRINWFGYPVFSRREPVYYAVGSTLKRLRIVNNDVALSVEPSSNKEKQASVQSSPLPPEKKNPPQPLRTNFNETAFFYPNLVTDSSGTARFSFTTPDALTRWKFMVLAYTKEMKTGSFVRKFTARKALMVIPNLPRFVRQGDRLTFTARLSNLSEKTLPVKVNIEFFNPENRKKLNLFLTRKTVEQQVMISPGKNALVSWLIHIPQDIQFLAYRIKVVSGNVSDGEERMIPVLSNRELITESMPMFVNGNRKKTFTFASFLNDTSATRKNFRYTLTFTSHPAWYAVQALPYLSRPQFESAENIFYRFYAHALAEKLLKTYPRIQQVFAQWKQQSPDAFLSALQKDKELKNIVLQAAPWVLDAQNETEQKRRIALFFDLNQMQQKQQSALNRLQVAQLPSGAWPWFSGMPADFFTTENILSGLTDLVQMKAIDLKHQPALKMMLQKGLRYLDNEMVQEYSLLQKRYPKTLSRNHLTPEQIRYCYLRSGFLTTIPLSKKAQIAFDYFSGQIKRYWPKLNNNLQALSAMTLNRLGWGNQAEAIIRALNEKSLLNKENGMFWRSDNRFYSNMSAISTEVDVMKAFVEVMNDTRSADKMKTWLLMQKQANHWPGTKATADAVYALLMNGSHWLSETKPVEISFGNGEKLSASDLHREAGSGYIKKVWTGDAITPVLGKITVNNPNKGMTYGAAYLQYFEDINKVSRQSTDVSIEKTFFKEVITAKGNEWVAISVDTPLKTGDRVMVRLLIRTNRAVDYVHVQDMRAAAFEPEKLLSGYERKSGLSYYEEVKDVATNFFIRHLPKGTFVLEYPLLVAQKGVFSGGIARIRSLYLPSFAAHSSGTKIKVR
ncbi:MAG: hypothetical protein IEMM0006_0052 [bacterium]|nr:MAG: hypothetical protein IEMM0006_0052 [bacterium]